MCQGPHEVPVVHSKVGKAPAGIEAVALFDYGGNLLCLGALVGDHRSCDSREWSLRVTHTDLRADVLPSNLPNAPEAQ